MCYIDLMDRVQKALDAAKEARSRAYAPYSHYQVGAAFLLPGEETVYSGCNVENASYGASVCAERTALFRIIADRGRTKPEQLVVVTSSSPAEVPCALCLQVLAEFCDDDFRIHLANADGIEQSLTLKELLPRPFRLSP
jgi:homotetrameric cytidine deaminase